ncbi:MAG: phytase, partial [Gammaproteobacteria bacterium]|nr:phytase [Gammaproteobacteria bacterium]
MQRYPLKPLAALALSSLLLGCSNADSNSSTAVETAVTPASSKLQHWQPSHAAGAESWQLLANNQRLAADAKGIWLLDAKGNRLAQHPGHFYSLDVRQQDDQLLIATTQTRSQQPTLLRAEAANLHIQQQLVLPATSYRIENLCLYQDESKNLHLFVVGEEGMGDQWLVGNPSGLLDSAAHVRSLRLPPEGEHCAVDDQQHLLYVSEESIGIWAYGAHPEAEQSRQPVDMVKPFGAIQHMVAGLATVPGGLLALDADAQQLHRYRLSEDGWDSLEPITLDGSIEPERL